MTNQTMVQASIKYVLSLFISLSVAMIAVIPFEKSPDPGTLPRLVGVLTFLTIFTLLFLWDKGYVQ